MNMPPANDIPPQEGYWTAPRVKYMRDVLELFLLVVALPWLVWKLLTDPIQFVRQVGQSAVS